MNRLHAEHALLPEGFAAEVLLAWDEQGRLTTVRPGAAKPEGVERIEGLIVPGLPNLHSHAFQRAFAGLTEYRGAAQDSFWTWRDRMYRFAGAITPDQMEAVATQLYVEMLRAGYTSVCEFHYVHHDNGGEPYADRAEMALRLAAAARRAGIGLTLLPVLYQTSGFGAKPPRADQKRFLNRVDELLRIVEALRAQDIRSGVAPHSLRAVPPPALKDLVDGITALDPGAPIHIHVAEQTQEVDDCLAWSGARPLQWLLDHAPVDSRWCLVHATHLDDAERAGAARAGAVIGLCPSTEANLGDGLFDLPAWTGAWGIGSDSHASVDAAEELRLLEYGQRLARRQRNVGLAERMWNTAVAGGAQAAGRAVAGLAPGQQADFVRLADAMLDDLAPAERLASHLFASHRRDAVRDVWVAGRRVVQAGRHAAAPAAERGFLAARGRLREALR
ncbi:formimidoylglutamate deiminase [Piscinibacter sp.]|uniref:formimidoylglutamate deiminase n=1 Tax=Piscinibacter sp. TaxID=1903157 RepID=UPI0039E5ED62